MISGCQNQINNYYAFPGLPMAGKPAEQFAVGDDCAAQELQPRGFFMGCQRAPAALRYDNPTFAIA